MSTKDKSVPLMHVDEAAMEIYRRDWEKRLGRYRPEADQSGERSEEDISSLIEHVGYDSEQLGREK